MWVLKEYIILLRIKLEGVSVNIRVLILS